jgi:phosphoribosyl 1,2-cyclic phosphodiesterase
MIEEGYRVAGLEINPYLIFIKSLPFNFYCWFTFAMLFAAIFRRFNIGSMRVYPIPLSHPNQGSGYKFIEDGKVFIFLTDNELGYVHPGGRPFEDYLKFCMNADLLFHDAEYTPKEYEQQILWGHSSFADAIDLALQARVKKFGLFHMNQERTDIEVDTMLARCRERIHAAGSDMECCVVAADMVFEL